MNFNVFVTLEGDPENPLYEILDARWEDALATVNELIEEGTPEEWIGVERVQKITLKQFKDFIND